MINLSTNSNIQMSRVGLFPQEEMLETGKAQRQITIGIPKETSRYESRISLTPQAVEMLVMNGNQLIIESGAGDDANYSDMLYADAGASIVNSKKEVYDCEIVLKVAPLTLSEIELLKNRQTVISSVNISTQNSDNFRKLMEKKVTAIGFEYIKDQYDDRPVLRCMSEIAGRASIMVASELLSNANKGKGILLGGVTGISPTEVAILGAGTASEYAARAALGLGAIVKVFDSSTHKLRNLQRNLGHSIFTSVLQPKVLSKTLKSTDVLIGAMHYYDHQQPFPITEDMVRQMKKGSIIIDLNIDNGSCFETARITDHGNPTFVKHDIVHYCVPNIASRFARTASIALSNVFAPLLMDICVCGGITQTLKDNTGFRQGVYLFNGILTNQFIGKIFNIKAQDINLLITVL